jgi:isopentenyldiphosphate isomerase
MKQEQLDIFDENMNHIGTASREEVHRKGYWHRTFYCWLVSQDGDTQYILFQKRHPNKDVYPNVFDVTVAGHLLAGEEPRDGVREIEEELGLIVAKEDIVLVGVDKEASVEEVLIDKEFFYSFLYESNLPLDAYRLQEEEVTGIIKMEIGQAIQLFSGKIHTSRASGMRLDENGSWRYREFEVQRSDFAPHADDYYMKIFEAAKQYFDQGISSCRL